MDSKERDQRAKDGFGDRGEKLYNPKKNQSKKNFRNDFFDKIKKKIQKVLTTK